MIDSSLDPDFAALERQESLKEVRPSAADAAPRIYRGKLAALSSHPDQNEIPHCTTTTPDYDSTPPPDPIGHLRSARLGFAFVVILVLYWVWIRQRRQR